MHLKTFYIGLYFKDGKFADFKCMHLSAQSTQEIWYRIDIKIEDILALIFYMQWYSATAYGIITEDRIWIKLMQSKSSIIKRDT